MTFEQSSLWQAAFPSKPSSKNSSSDKFKNAYASLRDKVAQLTGLIVKDMPDYTVHDITHLDALWEIGSEIVGPNYPLNPPEAFVLGHQISQRCLGNSRVLMMITNSIVLA